VRYPLMICALCSPSSTNCCVACQKVSLLLAARSRTTHCAHLAFFQELPGKQHHAGRAIPNLPIHRRSVMLGIARLSLHSHLSVL